MPVFVLWQPPFSAPVSFFSARSDLPGLGGQFHCRSLGGSSGSAIELYRNPLRGGAAVAGAVAESARARSVGTASDDLLDHGRDSFRPAFYCAEPVQRRVVNRAADAGLRADLDPAGGAFPR